MTEIERPAAAGASQRPARRRSRRAAGPAGKGGDSAPQNASASPAHARGSGAAKTTSGRGADTASGAAPRSGDSRSAGAASGSAGGRGPASAGAGGGDRSGSTGATGARRRRRRGRGRGRGRGPGPGEARTGTAVTQGESSTPKSAAQAGAKPAAKAGTKPASRQGTKPGKGSGKNVVKSSGKPGTRGGRQAARGTTRKRTSRGPHPTLRTTRETSAGGMVVRGLADALETGADGATTVREDALEVALIGRLDRRGRMLWSMPKGHVEPGESHAQTARREVLEETGLNGTILDELGSIEYWFVADGKRIHKTVHHHLIRYDDGDLCDEDPEITEVAWVPFKLLPMRLAYEDERRLIEKAKELLPAYAAAETAGDNPVALPAEPVDPARREASRARHLERQRAAEERANSQAASSGRAAPSDSEGRNDAGGDTARSDGSRGRRRRRRGRGRGGQGRGGQGRPTSDDTQPGGAARGAGA